MPSSITANLNSPYLSLWQARNDYSIIRGFTASGNVLTVGTHPLSTGDTVYLSDIGAGEQRREWLTRFVISISSTQISLATSYANAIAGTAAAIPIRTEGGENFGNRAAISNVPVVYQDVIPALGINIITQPFLSYAKSAQSFSVNDNVAIDFTVPGWGVSYISLMPIFWAFGLVSDTGEYKLGLIDAMFFQYGDSITGTITNTTYRNDQPNTKSTLTFNCRILIQNQRASIQIKTTTNTYITLFTSSILSTNIQGLRFFSSLALNGTAFTNCTITYL